MYKRIIGILLVLVMVFSMTACDELFVDEVVQEKNPPLVEGDGIEVHFIDVGQGDGILIKNGDQFMLIDAGDNSAEDIMVDYLREQGVKKLEYVIGTHPHADHIGGLDKVIDNFNIGKVIMPDVIATTKTFEDVLDSIAKKKLKITKGKAGDKYDFNGAEFILLAPNSDEYSNVNNYSIVIKLTYGENSFLFTGDAEELSEKEILNNYRNLLKSDVLKLGHHGSSTSSSQEFLDVVNPKYGVITLAADNKYGHPHREIMDRVTKKKMKIYRTDLDGTIIAKSDGKVLEFVDGNMNSTTNNDIIISHIDKYKEIVILKNNSNKDIQLEGWKLLSLRGNQEFIFPKYILKPNEKVIITSGPEKGDLNWGQENVWNNTESDPGILYNKEGKEIYRYDD